jgi:diguanylate cyclase (GGDEF)-like protein/PAS domain S-box-containing protein
VFDGPFGSTGAPAKVTMKPDHTLLLIDDEPRHAEALKQALLASSKVPRVFEWTRTLSGGLDRLSGGLVWAVFVARPLPDARGCDPFDAVLAAAGRPAAPAVVLIGNAGDEDACQAALSRGAQDYLLEGHLDRYDFARAIRQIEEREAASRDMFTEKERAQVTLNAIGDGVLSTDLSGRVIYLNATAERMTGWPNLEALGQPIKRVFHVVDTETHRPSGSPLEFATQLDLPVGFRSNRSLIRRDGHEIAVELSSAPIHDRDGWITGAVIVVHDVSGARAMALELSHLAQHDVLTGLPNRMLFEDRLTQAVLVARRAQGHLAVLFLDLDGFKRINDSLGHAIGDRLIQSVAERLLGCVRKSDTVSRQGGDEFVILLPAIAKVDDAALCAAKIIEAVKAPHAIGEHSLRVTVSVGISTYPDSGGDAEALMKNADTAMYHVKGHGRDHYRFFKRDMNLLAVERQYLEGHLRTAIDGGELLLHYQPQIDLVTGAISSVEALVRWQQPVRGLLLPAQFLLIAEESGMIIPIGRWVLEEACRQTREWLDAGLRAVPVAVNISSAEFRSGRFLEGVRAALDRTRLDPRYLELELTEGVLMHHAESAAHALGELKALGVKIAVDDFGTGYSSLSCLTRFPIDALKLDRSFVHDIGVNADHAIVVKAVINMGRSLKHRVIAEGVETPEQLAFLRGLSCDEGQGYYFSRPLPATEFAKLLKRE